MVSFLSSLVGRLDVEKRCMREEDGCKGIGMCPHSSTEAPFDPMWMR